MTSARAVLLALFLTALAAGIGMYYLQVYAFYEEVEAPATLPLAGRDGAPAYELAVSDFRGIDASSSPIRYRACLDTPPMPPDSYPEAKRLGEPRPPNAPGWFDCFDARAIGEALETGEARAFVSLPDVTYGIDRVVALYPDGRAFAWHQINACGEVVFDGGSPPEGCPPVPERPN